MYPVMTQVIFILNACTCTGSVLPLVSEDLHLVECGLPIWLIKLKSMC